MNIGKAASQSGVPAKTIRYYESIGLVAEPNRTPSGYRDYDEADIETLKFVHRARSLGFPIRDVASLLDLWRDRDRSSAQVKALTQRHIDEIGQRIDELQSIRKTLMDLSRRCHGDNRPDCPILEDLAAETRR